MPKYYPARLVRILPDGRRELLFDNGRRMYARWRRCAECNIEGPETNFLGDRLCLECVPIVRKAERAAKKAENRARAARRLRTAGRRRMLLLKLATPPWADRREIAKIYKECRRRTREEGIQYQVDHIWPIDHGACCGLHVHWNLQILTATENSRKNNKLIDGRPGTRNYGLGPVYLKRTTS